MHRFQKGKGKWAFRTRRLSRSDRAISTIMANLTMLIIVVFLSTLLFTWSIASFGAYQTGAGYWFGNRSLANQERISVENVFFYERSGWWALIYVRNVGTIEFTVGSVYVNSGILPSLTTLQKIGVNNVTLLGPPSSACLPLPTCGYQLIGYTIQKGDLEKITIASSRGTTTTTSWVA